MAGSLLAICSKYKGALVVSQEKNEVTTARFITKKLYFDTYNAVCDRL